LFRMLLFFAAMWGFAPTVEARSTKNPFRVEAETLALAAGAAGRLRITIAVPKDHHIYRDMVEVVVIDAGGLELAEASYPPGLKKPDPADPATLRQVYDMDVIIEVPVAGVVKPGVYPVTLQVTYQGCKKSLCWMPQTDEIQARVRVRVK